MQADPIPEDVEYIRSVVRNLLAVTTKGQLGEYLAQLAGAYSLMDLQILGGSLFIEVENLPEPYRSRVRPFFSDQIFGAHHRLLAMYRSGEFHKVNTPITDMDTFRKFCEMIPEGCFTWDDEYRRTPFNYTPKHRLFYYMMAAFTMFVLDKPGHPVGMPFPGGFTVEDRRGTYYCLIRDREKEVFFSICNFCPAKQTEENAP
ncbi:MAG TPA: DUF2115 domain-containing protein [Methanoregula sp.]|nr:DUF2115 domain-containing protein [Methanoregula sp.]